MPFITASAVLWSRSMMSAAYEQAASRFREQALETLRWDENMTTTIDNARGVRRPFNPELAHATYDEWATYHANLNHTTVEGIQEVWGTLGYLTETNRTYMGEVKGTNDNYFNELPTTEDLKADEFFTKPDFEIEQEDTMYSVTQNLSNASSEVFKQLIPSIKFKSKLGFLASLTNHPDFNETMKSYVVAQRTAMLDYLCNIIQTSFSPFLERVIHHRGEYNSTLPSLSGMFSVFLRRQDENNGTVDTLKVVAVCKSGFLIRLSYLGTKRFKYHFFYINDPLSDGEFKQISDSGFKDCYYFPKLTLTNRLSDVSSESACQEVTKEMLLNVLKGHRIPVRDKDARIEETTRMDVFRVYNTGLTSLVKGFETTHTLMGVKAYNLDELRLSVDGERPQVLIGTVNRPLTFKGKRGINQILSLALRSFPLMAYKSGSHNCKILAPYLNEDGSFDSKKDILYNTSFYCSGRTLLVEFMCTEYSICLAFLLDSLQLDLNIKDIDLFKEVIQEDYEALKLETIKDYKVLNNLLSQNVGKIARKMAIQNITSGDKFYVDENFKSFFDGMKSSLEQRLARPVSISGKLVDARTTPKLHEQATREPKRLLDLIKSITNRNYYNGGVCVNIKRD